MTSDAKLEILCLRCQQATKHSVHAAHRRDWFDDFMNTDSHEECEILRCDGCDAPTFRRRYWNSLEPEMCDEFFPPRRQDRRAMPRWNKLPLGIWRVYQETLHALNHEQAILAGVGIRALVEAVANHKRAKGKNLKARIRDLAARGFVSKHEAAALQRTRVLGNKAAHQVSPTSSQALAAAFRIVEHLLEAVYLLRGLGQEVGRKPE